MALAKIHYKRKFLCIGESHVAKGAQLLYNNYKNKTSMSISNSLQRWSAAGSTVSSLYQAATDACSRNADGATQANRAGPPASAGVDVTWTCHSCHTTVDKEHRGLRQSETE